MTRHEAYEYWLMRYNKAKDYNDPHWEAPPPLTWYTADENQPDSAGDDVLIVDRDDEYRIAYYCSKGNWIDTNTGNPIEVVKWRYLRWDNDEIN